MNMELNENKVVVAMSGGVDSSVVAAILKQEGYDVIGVTIKTWGYMQDATGAPKRENACCSLDAISDAKAVARQFDFPHYVVDYSERFEKVVIENFVEEYLKGRTPNPCVLCNRKIKWEELLTKADELGAKYIATGHYAETGFDDKKKRFFLRNARDSHKDQTYALWGLTQESLSRTLLPLGKYTKEEVRKLAEELDLQIAKKPDSQEICFVEDNNYGKFISERVPDKTKKSEGGKIIFDGKVVGKHKGLHNYTIGQRKGLGVTFPFPVYVKKIDVDSNTLEIAKKEDLFTRQVKVSQLNLVSVGELQKGERIYGKIRYKDNAALAEVIEFNGDNLIAEFYEPKLAVTPGQSAVFYDEQGYLLAGGIIE